MKTKLLILLTMLFACIVQVKGATSTVEVGTGNYSNSAYSGFCACQSYFAEENLYLSSELNGKKGFITKYGFKVASSEGTISNATVKIYMAQTSQTTLTASNMLETGKMTEVYNSSSTTLGSVSSDNWNELSLRDPFYYDGKSNLLVAVTVVNNSTTKNNVKLSCDNKTNRRIRKYSNTDSSYSNLTASGMSSSDWFPVTRFTFQVESTESVIGQKETTSASNGFGEYYRNYAGQTLFLADEIGQTGQITEIAFQAQNSAGTTIGDLEIYMAETDLTELNNASKLTKSEMTQVYDGKNITMAQLNDGYVSVVLNTPFKYSGTKNLVVAISSKKATYKKVDYNCRNISGRCVRVSNDTESGGTVTPFDSNLSASTYVPVTRFGFNIRSKCSEAYTIKGTGTATSASTGFNPWYRYYSAQFLYPADSLKMGYYLTSIGFEVKETNGSVSSNVKVYLAETDWDELNSTQKLTVNQMTLVYEGTKTLGSQTGWEVVSFNKNTPYLYTGKKNLVIAVSTSNSTDMPKVFYACRSGLSGRSVKWQSDNDTDYANFPSSITPISNSDIPNVRFLVLNHIGSTYTPEGLGICKTCGQTLPYSYQSPTYLASYTYGVTKPNQFNYIAQQVAWGNWKTNHKIYIQNDIDMSGHDVTAIGTNKCPFVSKLYGYNYSDKVGHTISGLDANGYLIEKLGTDGLLQSVRLASGRLVKTGTSGKVSSCLTLGDALFGSRTSTVIDSSFYKSSSANTSGGRTLTQMKSGMVTYGLNHASVHPATWYQTIGSDDYPVFNSSRGTVARCTRCGKVEYNNTASDDGKTYNHNWVNTICSLCNSQPTTISENMTLVDGKPYQRTKVATISSGYKVTYSRTFSSTSWCPLYLPISVQYTNSLAQNVEIAELSAYGVKDDTNNDGNINSQDQRKLTMSLLKVGDTTEPNKPYLVRAKKTGTISFPSYGATLAKNDENSLALSTMKETFVATGCYSSKTVTPAKSNGKILNSNGTRFFSVSPSASSSPFRWVGEISNNNGTAWDQSLLPIVFTDCAYPEFAIVDNETSSYKRATEVTVKNFSYSRIFADRQIGNWQSLYLPFDLTMTSDMLEDVEIARLDDVTTKAGVDYFVVTKLESGQTLEANTLAVIRIKDSALDEDHYWNLSFDQVTLKPAANTKKVFETDQAKYTFTGVYEPYSNDVSTWYAIAKSDGLLHEAASGAKLPAYRFYMTIDGGTTSAAEIRIGFLENDPFATGIREVEEDDNQTGVYTLDGRRVQSESIQPGIYVKNGKKIWVK